MVAPDNKKSSRSALLCIGAQMIFLCPIMCPDRLRHKCAVFFINFRTAFFAALFTSRCESICGRSQHFCKKEQRFQFVITRGTQKTKFLSPKEGSVDKSRHQCMTPPVFAPIRRQLILTTIWMSDEISFLLLWDLSMGWVCCPKTQRMSSFSDGLPITLKSYVREIPISNAFS